MANISKFVSSFQFDVSRPCNFDVIIPPLPGQIYSATELHLRCEATELPGRTFAMAEQKTYGPVQRFPIQNAYDNIQLTFICDDGMEEKKIFDGWMNYISDAQPFPVRGNFDFKYKQSYTRTIKINQRTLDGRIAYTVDLIEAFPFAVNPVNLNWGDVDNYNKLSVMFNYRYFTNPEFLVGPF